LIADTPKALANFSPGLLQPWEKKCKESKTLKALGVCDTELLQSSMNAGSFTPGLKQPWGEISQRLRR
jgi:hypothetical protein